ncbi:testis-expressed protein 26 [Pholidichthys leucotaenia]
MALFPKHSQPMNKQWWDPYETSHRRQFVYQPNPATELLQRPMSTSLLDSFSKSRPFSSTVYSKEFCWKSACKPDCIRTGTASGHRRNNPHPSKAFIMWRLPRESSEYITSPWKLPPSEGEICKALTAQYCSTYCCDFMGIPQGYNDINKTERRLAPLHNVRHKPFSTGTEMRAMHRQPEQKPELLGHLHHYSSRTDPGLTCCGIVPAIVQRHVHSQPIGSNPTTYDRFFGKRVNNVTPVIKSLLPHELQQLHTILPEKENEAVKTDLNKDDCIKGEKEHKFPAVVSDSCTQEWISSWPGPQ